MIIIIIIIMIMLQKVGKIKNLGRTLMPSSSDH